MLTQDEKKFLDYWEKNSEKEKKVFNRLKFGLLLGGLMGVGILLSFISGWYKRANMVAFTQSTPLVLILALIAIVIFCSIFYNRHRWEMNDQRYQILQKRKTLENNEQDKQQSHVSNSPIN